MLKTTAHNPNHQVATLTSSLILLSALILFLSPRPTSTAITQLQPLSTHSSELADAEHQQLPHHTLSDPLNDAVNAYTTIFSTLEEAFPFEQHIKRVATELKIEESLVYAVTKAESSFRAEVQSHAGAVGLMQVVASAAGRDAYYRLYKKRATPTSAQLKDPYTNLQLGSTYLKLLEEHHFGHITDKELKQMLVLAAYNWGPVNVKRKLLAKNPPRNVAEMKWVLWTKAPRETYSYVHKVLKFQTQFDQFEA